MGCSSSKVKPLCADVHTQTNITNTIEPQNVNNLIRTESVNTLQLYHIHAKRNITTDINTVTNTLDVINECLESNNSSTLF